MDNFLYEALELTDQEQFPNIDRPPVGDYIARMPRREGAVEIVNLGSIINWFMTGQLLPYANNRGCGRLSKKTMESAYAGVKGDSLGECTIGYVEMPANQLERVRVMVLADFHSRLGGFLKRWLKNEMTVRELKTPISVRVVSNHMESYQSLNAGDPHRTKDKIKNPDLSYGKILNEISAAVGEEAMAMIGDNKWTILSSLIYNLQESQDRDWNWPQVYQKRQLAMKIANEVAGFIKISKRDQQRLIDAIKYWHNLMMAVESKAAESGVSVSKVTRNAGFFGFIICDRMWQNPHFSSETVMVRKIMKNLDVVKAACPELCRGNRDRVLTYSFKLADVFNQKKTQAEVEEV